MYEKFIKLPEHMKYMKHMIPEKPAITIVSLFSIARTTGNNALPSPQKKQHSENDAISSIFPVNPSIDQIKNTFRRYA